MLTKLYAKTQAAVYSFLDGRKGVTAIEYAIIGVAIATVVAAVFSSNGEFEGALKGAMSKITSKVDGIQ